MLGIVAAEPAYTGPGAGPEADWWTELYEMRGTLVPERMPTYALPDPYMNVGVMYSGLGQSGLGQIDRGGDLLTTLGLLVLSGAIALGVGAAYGHIAYGDWACGFRTCVVQPGWKRGAPVKLAGAETRWRRRAKGSAGPKLWEE